MRFLRWFGDRAGLALWPIVLAPALALVLATIVDRGPAGNVRAGAFALGLGVFDPFVWDCLRNSLVVAAAVTCGSLALGVPLAGLFARRRFWGRGPLVALALAPIAIPPFVAALGLRIIFGGRLDVGLAPGAGPTLGWLCWAWVGLASGVPLVAAASALSLAGIEPAWIDAARLAGAGRLRIWRQLVWPVARPEIARAAATVFTVTLVEPGAPLLLGLRRTLAFQIVDAALGPDTLSRAAVLSLIALIVAVLVRSAIGWWGGTAVALAPSARDDHIGATSWAQATVRLVLLGAAVLLTWFPALAVMGSVLGPSWANPSFPSGPAPPWRDDPESRRYVANAMALGLAVVAIDYVLAGAIVRIAAQRRRLFRLLALWPAAFPPLVVGVGALSVPWLVKLTADGGASDALPWMRNLARLPALLDPYQTPGLLLAISVAAILLPSVAMTVADGRARLRPVLYDAALTAGATARRARRIAKGGWSDGPLRLLPLTFSLAAMNLAAAIVLAPISAGQTITTGVLMLADAPGDGLSRAAQAAAANVLALAFAAGGRKGRVREWVRTGFR
jgi:ABC-type Fe3+ transport system permease subunit